MKIRHPALEAPAGQSVLRALQDAGHRALYVGGTVRNVILGREVTDLDVATDARPERAMEVADRAGLKAIPTGISHGTVTIVSHGVPVEVTTFRKDVETDGRRARVAFSDDLSEDAHRRDFTMNALYAAADGTVHDPLGGVPDARAGRVRFIGTPAHRIAEDYLRILRFFRFTAWYGNPDHGIDAEGLAAVAAALDGLAQLSRERVGSEVCKLLAAPDCAPEVAAMAHAGVLAAVLPGANTTALAPLIDLETRHAIGPDPIRRLASLGAFDVKTTLRLSNADTRRYQALRAAIESEDSALELGYRLKMPAAADVLLLKSALLEQPVDPDALKQAEVGAAATFPVRAADLPHLSGPALGAELRRLEALWFASGCTADRGALLSQT